MILSTYHEILNADEETTVADDDVPEPPAWLESVDDVNEKSSVVTVRTNDGGLVRYLVPRQSIFEIPKSNGNGNGNGKSNHKGSQH